MIIRSPKELVYIDNKIRTVKYEFDNNLGFRRYISTIIDKNKLFEVTKYNTSHLILPRLKTRDSL